MSWQGTRQTEVYFMLCSALKLSYLAILPFEESMPYVRRIISLSANRAVRIQRYRLTLPNRTGEYISAALSSMQSSLQNFLEN